MKMQEWNAADLGACSQVSLGTTHMEICGLADSVEGKPIKLNWGYAVAERP